MAYWLYFFATNIAPFVPERFGYWVFAQLGSLAFLLGRKTRNNYLNNLTHVLGPNAPRGDLMRIARKAFQNSFKNYFDLFRGHRLSEAQLRAQLAELIGFEYLENAIAQGRGVIGGSAHFGNFNLIIHLAAVYLKSRCHVVVPNERLRPPRLFDLVVRQRAAQGIEIVPVDASVRTLIKTLRSGGMVGLAFDLDATNTGILVDFFGAPARLPDGAVVLALKYDVPLIIGFTRRLDDNRCKVVIEPPLQLERTGDFVEDTRLGVRRIAERIEEWVRRYPEQWIMFQPIWDDRGAGLG